MTLSIVSNLASMMAQQSLGSAQAEQGRTLERLSTGFRVNRAADDSAGMATSARMEAEARSLAQAERNAMDAYSLMSTMEGAVAEIGSILIRMRDLAVQSATDTVSASDRVLLNQEFVELRDEIFSIHEGTDHNGKNMINRSGPNNLHHLLPDDWIFQVGIRASVDGDQIRVGRNDTLVRVDNLTVHLLEIPTRAEALDALSRLDYAQHVVANARGVFGATQNRIQIAAAQAASMREHTLAIASRIRDADLAEETSKHVRSKMLQQAGVAVLAQANLLPSMVLSLIDGA